MKNILIAPPDKKALKILLDYSPLASDVTSSKDIEYAMQAGLMFKSEEQTHDKAMQIAFESLKSCRKEHITDLFLASLSTNRLEWRAGLSVFAIMQTFPKHDFMAYSSENTYTCRICSSSPAQKVDFSFLNSCRFGAGGTVTNTIYEFAFYLQQHMLLPKVEPDEADFAVFDSIFDQILNAVSDETPSKLQKKLRVIEGFMSTEEQRRMLIDTLGYCSIMETNEHKGFLTTYTNLGLVRRKSRSSDWHYPVDWWTGKDGINKEAFKFWFGNYSQLKKYWQ